MGALIAVQCLRGGSEGAVLCSEEPTGSEEEIGGEGQSHGWLPVELGRVCVSTSPTGDGGEGLIPKTWTATCWRSCGFPWPLAKVKVFSVFILIFIVP